jgi:hypothetical protein
VKKFRELLLAAVPCLMPAVAAVGAAHTVAADPSRTTEFHLRLGNGAKKPYPKASRG